MRHASLGIELKFRSFCAFLPILENPNVGKNMYHSSEFQNRNIYLSLFDTEVIRQRYGRAEACCLQLLREIEQCPTSLLIRKRRVR